MKNVQDILRLTPMQRVMLLHSSTARGADTLFNQFVYRVEGAIDGACLRESWQRSLRRHDSLRAAFLWEGLEQPIQVIRNEVELPFDEVECRGLSVESQAKRLQELCDEDRKAAFDLSRAPLTRLKLLHFDDDTHALIWSSHHLVMDRWCVSILLDEVLDDYRRLRAGEALELPRPAPSIRDYVRWIGRRPLARTRSYWARELAQIDGASRCWLASPPSISTSAPSERASLSVPAAESKELRHFARSASSTPSIVLQAAWALALSRRSSSDDLVFGITAAGRPAELPGVESMIGSFVSNVPVRVRLRGDQKLIDLIREMHLRQQQRSAHDYLSSAELHELSGLAPQEPLFDSIFVWLAAIRASEQELEFRLHPQDAEVETAWPLTLSVAEESDGSLLLALQKAPQILSAVDLQEVLADLRDLLRAMLVDLNQPLSSLVELPEPSPEPSSNGSVDRNGVASAPAEALAASPIAGGREPDELDMVRSMLLAECCDLLDREDLSLEVNFFDVGGNSILATTLHARLEELIGRRIPLLTLFQAETLEEMAGLIAQADFPVRMGPVRRVKIGGERPPLFCLAPPNVNSTGYVLLARHLPKDQPVTLVQTPPETAAILRMTIQDVPRLGEEYAAAIRKHQPEGPYRLIGMCDGALLAVEAARLLRAEGAQVDFVGILNTFTLNTLSWRSHLVSASVRMRYYWGRLKVMRELSWSERKQRFANALGRGPKPVEQTGEAQASTEAQACAGPAVTWDVVAKEWSRLDRPSLPPWMERYPGEVTVFRIRRQSFARIRDEYLGWRSGAEKARLVYLDTRAGSRWDSRPWPEPQLDILREPDVRVTAASVDAVLREADEGEGR